MNKKILYIVLVVAVLVLLYGGMVYNSLVSKGEGIDNQWAQVESQYQRRFDLIPNLVNSVKGIMKQEQEVFGKLADARTKYGSAATVNEKAAAATEVESALGRLLVVMENYPQLKSSDTVITLMSQLEGAENRISVERMRFNDATKEYNLVVKRFPSSLIASMFSFSEKNYFEPAAGAENVPSVSLQ